MTRFPRLARRLLFRLWIQGDTDIAPPGLPFAMADASDSEAL